MIRGTEIRSHAGVQLMCSKQAWDKKTRNESRSRRQKNRGTNIHAQETRDNKNANGMKSTQNTTEKTRDKRTLDRVQRRDATGQSPETRDQETNTMDRSPRTVQGTKILQNTMDRSPSKYECMGPKKEYH
jgi:hypothetical protein